MTPDDLCLSGDMILSSTLDVEVNTFGVGLVHGIHIAPVRRSDGIVEEHKHQSVFESATRISGGVSVSSCSQGL